MYINWTMNFCNIVVVWLEASRWHDRGLVERGRDRDRNR